MAEEDLNGLPELFVERLQDIVGSDVLPQVIDSFACNKAPTFWVNPLKVSPTELVQVASALELPCEALEGFPATYRLPYECRDALTHADAFNEGRIYIQNLSSMLAPIVLDPQPGETILDLAAAPGGKTILIAALMQNEGTLSAVEAIRGRFFKLKANLEQWGVSIARTFLMDGRAVGRKTPERFDRVLLDAPCSSEARFNTRDAKTWSHWGLKKIKETSRKQRGLIQSAFASLKPGGTLLYCTCSFAPEENEEVVQHLIKKVGDAATIESITIPRLNQMPGLLQWGRKTFHPDMAKAVRILPDETTDGFFLCKLMKRS